MSTIIKTFIPSDSPNGLKIINLAGWDGQCFIVSRASLSDLKDRDESDQPGLYLLLGEDQESNEKVVYIGESETARSRIVSHNLNKDFWDTVVIFCGALNRADVKYLEHKATLLAQDISRYVVQNKVQPQENALSEADKAACDHFFDRVQFILSSFGFEVFDKLPESGGNKVLYFLKGSDFNATGSLLENGEFIVYAESMARVKEAPSFGGWAQNARQKFIKEGFLVDGSLSYKFSRDIVFRRPSAAAATVAGRAINGWTAWKDEKGKTLDENVRRGLKIDVSDDINVDG